MRITHILIDIILFMIIINLLLFSKREHLTDINNEALQNIASVYNNANMKVTNLEVTGQLKIGNKLILNENNSGNIITQGNIESSNNIKSSSANIGALRLRNSSLGFPRIGTTQPGTDLDIEFRDGNIYFPKASSNTTLDHAKCSLIGVKDIQNFDGQPFLKSTDKVHVSLLGRNLGYSGGDYVTRFLDPVDYPDRQRIDLTRL